MGTEDPINLARERAIREGGRLLANAGFADADALSRDLQESAEAFFAEKRRRANRRAPTVVEQWDAGLAEGEREGPF